MCVRHLPPLLLSVSGVLVTHVGCVIPCWWRRVDLNHRPTGYEPVALTAELRRRYELRHRGPAPRLRPFLKGAVCFLYTVAILRPHLPVFESGRRLGEELPPQLGSLVPEAGLEPAPRRTGF